MERTGQSVGLLSQVMACLTGLQTYLNMQLALTRLSKMHNDSSTVCLSTYVGCDTKPAPKRGHLQDESWNRGKFWFCHYQKLTPSKPPKLADYLGKYAKGVEKRSKTTTVDVFSLFDLKK
jgi:hypothetical protein